MPGMLPRSSAASYDDWDQHWDDLGDIAEGNPANRYRQRLILHALQPIGHNARILDVGSGQGEFAMFLCSHFPQAQVRGVEYSAEGVRRSRAQAASERYHADFWQRDLLRPADLDESERGWATHAVCSEVLEHVEHPDVLLAHTREYLAPDSRLVVTVPAGPRSAFDRHIGHRRHFTPDSLRSTLQMGGFEVDRIGRAGAPFFNLYRLAVMLRGRKLIDDLSKPGPSTSPDRKLQLAYRAFDTLFRLNLPSTPFGWQLVAVARPAPA